MVCIIFFFFSSRRRHTRSDRDWSSDVCSSDLSREAVAAKITTGKHFIWRVSSAWKLRRCGRPLPDGTWNAAITWRGRIVKVRVVEYHMDQVFALPPGHPLLAAPPPGVSVRVLGGGTGAACEQPDDGTIRVEVSETVTIITSLTD